MPRAGQAGDLLLAALREPGRCGDLAESQWDLLIRVARRAGLLAHLGWRLEDLRALETLPGRVREVLLAARVAPAHQGQRVRWEVGHLARVLGPLQTRLVLLKGAAYLMLDLPLARGRIVTDVDLLVPREALAPVEQALVANGWEAMKLQPYDQRYYRAWMHELPPLRHRSRQTVVDVHHTLTAPTSRYRLDPDRLLARVVPVTADPRFATLCPEDMVLNSTVHLFLEGDPDEGLRLRDLVDIRELLGHFGQEADFWDALIRRARELRLERLLSYALRYCGRLLCGPVPPGSEARTGGRPNPLVLALMDAIVQGAILPDHPDQPLRRKAFARWLAYTRAHWLRMPPGLLARHLARKARARLAGEAVEV